MSERDDNQTRKPDDDHHRVDVNPEKSDAETAQHQAEQDIPAPAAESAPTPAQAAPPPFRPRGKASKPGSGKPPPS